ncbi:hypothetical protein H5410_015229 [Solanum commersonii]|uniref:Uncharacterized protein n=1 Tax=Solanum commersonii TaxID=4109 RepID=A0A9J5ZSZ5_SOLCO|nr:hypothetical protein H5410_015229 [Solanum commersonii]
MDIEESYTTHRHTIHISTTTSPRYALKPYTIIGFTTIYKTYFPVDSCKQGNGEGKNKFHLVKWDAVIINKKEGGFENYEFEIPQ